MFDKTTHSDLRLRMPTATQLIMRSKVFVSLICLLKPWNPPIYCIRKPIQWPHSYLQLSGSNKGVVPSGVLAWSSGTPLGKEPQWHAFRQSKKPLTQRPQWESPPAKSLAAAWAETHHRVELLGACEGPGFLGQIPNWSLKWKNHRTKWI